MSNLRDLNNGPNHIFDFLNALAAQGQEHPLFAAYNPEARDRGDRGPPPPEYEDPPNGVPEGPAGPPPPSHEEPPPPPPGHGPPPHHHGHRGPHHGPPPHGDDPFDGHGFPFGGPPGGRGRHGGPHFGPHGRHGSHSHGRRGGWGGWGGRGGGRCGGRHGGNPFEGGWGAQAGGFDMSKLSEFISQFAPGFAPEASNNKDASRAPAEAKDFQPPVDIFETKEAFIVHVSLPGAKKEDVGANWDAEKSELSVAGVIYRPGDEETLKTLALDEREVGAFERKVTLGTKLNPAQVDAEGISAKMEDGVLIVNIPKLEQDFVEVKKVDIE